MVRPCVGTSTKLDWLLKLDPKYGIERCKVDHFYKKNFNFFIHLIIDTVNARVGGCKLLNATQKLL